jgi:hypothetical protein
MIRTRKWILKIGSAIKKLDQILVMKVEKVE